MRRKPFLLPILVLVLLLSVTTASARITQSGVNLDARAVELVTQKYKLQAGEIVPIGKPAKVRFPLQGITAVDSKFMDAAGNIYAITLNTNGQEVSIDTLSRAEKAAYEARHGKLDRNLLKLLRTAGANAKVEVDIWLMDTEGDLTADMPRPEVNGGDNQQAYATREEAERAESDAAAPDINTDALKAMEESMTVSEAARMEALTRSRVIELQRQGYTGVASDLAPVITVTLPVSVIRAWSKRPDVDIIYKSATLGNEMNIARKAVGADKVNAAGIKGKDTYIAVVEYGGMVSATNPYLSGVVRDNPFACVTGSHVTGIAGIIRSTKVTNLGIASGTNLWVGCGETNAEIFTSAGRGVNWGADTFSLSWYSDYTRSITTMDKFFDKFPIKYSDIVIKSAGNRGTSDGIVTSPGIGFNTVAVGSFDDANTSAWADDHMAYYSSYVDPLSMHGDREKPEIAAPGTNILSTTTFYPWIGDIGSGTSFAAPIVAGITSLMYDRNTNLIWWPEATKAILMASAWHNLEGTPTLSDVDGAGGVSAFYADTMARNNTVYGRWGAGAYPCYSITPKDLTTMNLYVGHKTRVVIVWNQNPWYWDYANRPGADLDLLILDPGKNVVAFSSSWDNTYEIVDFIPVSTGAYTLRVIKTRCDGNPKNIGWAWSSP